MAFNFLPKETNFFDLFEKQVGYAVETASYFKELVSKNAIDENGIDKMHKLEHDGDEVTHEIFDRLNKTFITPFDREDIHELASEMDNVIDLIQGTTSRMRRYQVKKISEELVRLAEILCEATETMKKAILGLREIQKPSRILEYCIEINSHENAGDQMQELAMEKLFANTTDAIEVIKWKEIYELTETAIDRCEDVANTIEAIVVKNG